MWRRLNKDAAQTFLLHRRAVQPFRNTPVTVEAGEVRESFSEWHAGTLDEYAYRFTGRAFVEPQHGYVVRGARTLLLESMPYHFYGGAPSFIRYLSQRATTGRRTVREQAIISLRDFEEANYFHFYNDVLAKLRVLEAWRETSGLPIVISRKLSGRLFFQDALRRSRSLSARRWIVQDDFFVEAEEIYCAKPLPHARENFDFALEVLNAPAANKDGSRRIFLTRNAGRKRGLTNAAEVESVCADFGFEIVDADGLRLDEQIELFAAARFVVGIHGAGLTNIIFRRGAPLTLLELFPPRNIPPHYAWICHHYGFSYDAIVGAGGDIETQSFRVDVEGLRVKLGRMLSE